MSILEQLAAHARERVAADKAENSLDVLQARCRTLGEGGGARFRAALERPGLETVIADPFLRPLLPPGWDGRFVENPQYAVSSKVEGWVAPMVGEAFNFWIEKTTGKKGL